MGRSWWLPIIVWMTFASAPAAALELAWPSGQRDITVTSTVPCTLLVRATPNDSLFTRPWRFIWVGTAAVDSPFVLLASSGILGGNPAPAALPVPQPLTDGVIHQAVAVFDAPSGERPPAVAYLVRIDPSLQAKLALVPENPADGWPVDSTGLLTINGGTDVSFPPRIAMARACPSMPAGNRAASSNAGGSGVVRLSGRGLAAVASVMGRQALGSDELQPLPITARTESTLVAVLPARLSAGTSVIVASDASGLAAAAVTVPEIAESSVGYSIAAVADSAFWPGTMAINPADGSFALEYMHDPVNDLGQYYALLDGSWWTEDVPPEMPLGDGTLYGAALAIDKAGTAHTAGASNGALHHYWRTPGPQSTWQSEIIENGVQQVGKVVVRIDTVANVPEVMYSRVDSGRLRLVWSRRESGVWTYPEVIEDGWGQLGSSFDFTIDNSGWERAAYVYAPDSLAETEFPEEIVYACRQGHTGPWAKTYDFCTMWEPEEVSIAMDSLACSPIIAFIAINWVDDLRHGFVWHREAGAWHYTTFYGELTPSIIRVRVSPGGKTHVVMMEAGNDSSAVLQLTRESLDWEMYKPWVRDTVVAQGCAALGDGQVLPPLALELSGESPLVAFGYRNESVESARLCLASTVPVAGVGPPLRSGLLLSGPWPNPGRSMTGVRFGLWSDRRENVTCSLIDVRGARVLRERVSLAPGQLTHVSWATREVPPGLYFLRLQAANGATLVRRLSLLR